MSAQVLMLKMVRAISRQNGMLPMDLPVTRVILPMAMYDALAAEMRDNSDVLEFIGGQISMNVMGVPIECDFHGNTWPVFCIPIDMS